MAVKTGGEFGRLSARAALRLAAPQTWSASVMPVLLGTACAKAESSDTPALLTAALVVACILMQSAANTFNDYADFIKGTDTKENSPDPTDAVMLYSAPRPKTVFLLACAYLFFAAVCALPAIVYAGWLPLGIGIIGGLAVLAYSLGRKPVSYLPLGELVSGFVMGGLIPLAVYGVFTKRLELALLVRALPVMLGISLIMLTNNGCDIERDTTAGRRTFPRLLGAEKTGYIYRTGLLVYAALPFALLGSAEAAVMYASALAPCSVFLAAQLRIKLCPQERGKAMSGISTLILLLSLAYIGALLLGR